MGQQNWVLYKLALDAFWRFPINSTALRTSVFYLFIYLLLLLSLLLSFIIYLSKFFFFQISTASMLHHMQAYQEGFKH